MKTETINASLLQIGDRLDRGVKNFREVVRVRSTVMSGPMGALPVTEIMHRHTISGELTVMNFALGAMAKVFR